MKKMLYCFILLFFILLIPTLVYATIPSMEIMNVSELADILKGDGVEISNLKMYGNSQQLGKFNGASGITGFKNIGEGIVLSTGIAKDMFVPASTFLSTAYTPYSHGNIFDEVCIEFDVISDTNFVSFQYIFASEEFDQAPVFNDLMEIEVNGKNIALLPKNNETVCINSLRNTKYHYDNYNGTEIGFLGYTPLLSCQANVEPGKVNHFKISLKDLGDPIYDTALFIKAHSITNQKAPKPEENPNPPNRGYEKPIKVEKEISSVKLTLVNGTILYDVILHEDGTVTGSSSGFILADNVILTIDAEILHGAKLEIEYNIKVQNLSETPCISYIIEDFKDPKLIYNENQLLLTENKTNAYYGWKISDDEETLECEFEGGGVAINAGETLEKKIVLSKILSVSELYEDSIYQNTAEATLEFLRDTSSKEAESKKVVLLPPFGKANFTNFYIIGIMINIIIIVLVIYIKNSYVYKKNKPFIRT